MTKIELQVQLLLAKAQYEQSKAIVEAIRAGRPENYHAAESLKASFKLIQQAEELITPKEIPLLVVPTPIDVKSGSMTGIYADMSIKALPISKRIKNVLTHSVGIDYVGELIYHSDATLLKFPHMGPIVLNEIKTALHSIGLSLSTILVDWKPPTKAFDLVRDDFQKQCVQNFNWIYIKNICVYLSHFKKTYPKMIVRIGPSTEPFRKGYPMFGVYAAGPTATDKTIGRLPSYHELVNQLRIMKEAPTPAE